MYEVRKYSYWRHVYTGHGVRRIARHRLWIAAQVHAWAVGGFVRAARDA